MIWDSEPGSSNSLQHGSELIQLATLGFWKQVTQCREWLQ